MNMSLQAGHMREHARDPQHVAISPVVCSHSARMLMAQLESLESSLQNRTFSGSDQT